MYSFAISRNSYRMEYTDPKSFISELPGIPLIDVRSPVEYNKGHITGAMNIPIFSDEERSHIGSLYKQKGSIPAIQKGLEFVGPRMKKLAEEARSFAVGEQLKVYCWRGGMRSEKMSWLFELVGLHCQVLKGGFKAYRNQLLEDFKNLDNLIVLQGPTGSGKTDVLTALSKKGEQVIDLEALAKHRGSAFGHIGMAEQPTSLQFQNDLHAEFMKLDKTRKIWIESESLSIGKVYLPETLWESLNNASVIELSIPEKVRIERLVEEYGKYDISDLQTSTRKIGKKFGYKNVQDVLNFLEKGDLRNAAELLLNYYDKSYNFSQNKYKAHKPFIVKSHSGDPEVNADKIFNSLKEIRLEV
jgi:tRNA 2-selenouridine synthase